MGEMSPVFKVAAKLDQDHYSSIARRFSSGVIASGLSVVILPFVADPKYGVIGALSAMACAIFSDNYSKYAIETFSSSYMPTSASMVKAEKELEI